MSDKSLPFADVPANPGATHAVEPEIRLDELRIAKTQAERQMADLRGRMLAQIQAAHELKEQSRAAEERLRQADAELMQLNTETTQLTAVVTQLNAEIGRLNSDIARLNAEATRLNAETTQLHGEIARLNAEVAQLTAEALRARPELERWVAFQQSRTYRLMQFYTSSFSMPVAGPVLYRARRVAGMVIRSVRVR